ncbi:MAG: ParA family protein [Gammaproteobacteria bacterium]|nr:ParA family protein [Gammaproteobacteria bacterium]
MPTERGPACVSVINMKGGVGKTTITALLGREAVYRSLRVLAVDLDPQANLSQAYMPTAYSRFLREKHPSIVELFDGYRPPNRDQESPTPIDPSDIVRQVYRNGTLSYLPSRFDFSDNLVRSLKPDPQVLAQCIASHFADKDLILIDCPPTESVFTRAAYHASRYVLVPVRPEYFATVGFPLLAQSLAAFRTENPSHCIDVIGVVINNGFYPGGNDGGPEKRRAIREILEEAKRNGWHVFDTEIPHSRGFPKLMRGDRRYSGKASRFWVFAEEFFTRLQLEGSP